jgi:ribosomal protein S10
MNNELSKVKEIESEISIIEQSHKTEILSIHENINGLLERADLIQIEIDDVESYEDAINLKRIIKNTHIAIEKKRKELKAPIIDVGKKLDDFAKSIYEPLKDAEVVLKNKMLPYEENQQRIKEQERLEKEKEEKFKEELNQRLMQLNSMLQRINLCETKSQVSEIENYLNSINPKDFGERSDEAGFIVTNLKTTCMMIKKSLPDEIQQVLVEDENVVFEESIIPITEEKEQPVVFHDGMKYNPENPETTLEFDFSNDGDCLEFTEIKEAMENVFDTPKVLRGFESEVMLTNKSFSIIFNLQKDEEFPTKISITNLSNQKTQMFNLK